MNKNKQVRSRGGDYCSELEWLIRASASACGAKGFAMSPFTPRGINFESWVTDDKFQWGREGGSVTRATRLIKAWKLMAPIYQENAIARYLMPPIGAPNQIETGKIGLFLSEWPGLHGELGDLSGVCLLIEFRSQRRPATHARHRLRLRMPWAIGRTSITPGDLQLQDDTQGQYRLLEGVELSPGVDAFGVCEAMQPGPIGNVARGAISTESFPGLLCKNIELLRRGESAIAGSLEKFSARYREEAKRGNASRQRKFWDQCRDKAAKVNQQTHAVWFLSLAEAEAA